MNLEELDALRISLEQEIVERIEKLKSVEELIRIRSVDVEELENKVISDNS